MKKMLPTTTAANRSPMTRAPRERVCFPGGLRAHGYKQVPQSAGGVTFPWNARCNDSRHLAPTRTFWKVYPSVPGFVFISPPGTPEYSNTREGSSAFRINGRVHLRVHFADPNLRHVRGSDPMRFRKQFLASDFGQSRHVFARVLTDQDFEKENLKADPC